MDDIRERLLGRDYLYTDASAYRAGVEAALAALAAHGTTTDMAGAARPQALFAADEHTGAEAITAAVGHA